MKDPKRIERLVAIKRRVRDMHRADARSSAAEVSRAEAVAEHAQRIRSELIRRMEAPGQTEGRELRALAELGERARVDLVTAADELLRVEQAHAEIQSRAEGAHQEMRQLEVLGDRAEQRQRGEEKTREQQLADEAAARNGGPRWRNSR